MKRYILVILLAITNAYGDEENPIQAIAFEGQHSGQPTHLASVSVSEPGLRELERHTAIAQNLVSQMPSAMPIAILTTPKFETVALNLQNEIQTRLPSGEVRTRTLPQDWLEALKSDVETPTEREWAIGTAMGVFTGITRGIIWISVGLPVGLAAALTVAQTAVTFFHSAYIRTADKWFSRGATAKGEFARRNLWDLSWNMLWRAISGPVGGAHSVASIIGQAELLSIQGSLSVGALYARERHQRLSRRASLWMNFNYFAVVSTLSFLDLAGIHIYTLADLGFFKLHVSTLLTVGAILGLTRWVRKRPEFFERLTDWQDRLVTGARKARGANCRAAFSF